MSMELVLPPREPPARDENLSSPRRARRWLQEIERANDRESVRDFIEGIRRFNRVELRPGVRLSIAECLGPMTRYLVDRLVQRISMRKLPLDEASRSNFQALLTLLRERALAYDIVTAALASEHRPSRRKLALAIERALFHRGEIMLRSAPVHSPLPQNFWHDSNILYREAETHDCTDRLVSNDELIAGKHRQSVAAMYKRLLLFALAPTDGLRRGQAERLYQRTEWWCDTAELTTTPPTEPSITLYQADLAGPYGPVSAGSDPVRDGEVRWIDFAHVMIEAQRELPEAPPEGSVLAEGQVDAATLQRLIDNWSMYSGRASERVERGELVDVEVSLKRIHARLAAEVAPPEPARVPIDRQSLGSESTLALQTIEAPAHSWRQARDAEQPDDAAAPAEPTDEPNAAPAAGRATPAASREWRLVESGGGGFRLRWESGSSSTAVVGDLVALREEGAPGADDEAANAGHWTLGTIRRIRLLDEQRFDAGVQTLGDNPVAVTLRREPANPHRKRDRGSEPSEPGLMLPGVRERKIPPTVVVPANTFREGDVLEMDTSERVVRICLGRPRRESSAAFMHYTIAKPPERGRGAGKQATSPTAGE